MKLKVLGCSGGIGAQLSTTSFMLDENILIDAGTGVGELSLDQMKAIRHIFVTHAHLDHIVGIPLLVDTLFSYLNTPLLVHAHPDTIKTLKEHIFNWVIWPDFSELPDKDNPRLQFIPMEHGDSVKLEGRTIEMIPVNHAVPGVAYRVTAADGATFAFSGDTASNDTLWAALNKLKRLDLLIVECAFADEDEELSQLAKHYCPKYLGEDIKKLNHKPKIALTHFKPGDETRIFAECQAVMPGHELIKLSGGDVLSI